MTGLTLASLLADPMVQSVLIGLGAIIAHKYVPFLDGVLSKLPGMPATPGTPAAPGPLSADHPVISGIVARLFAVEQALLNGAPNAQPPASQPPVK